VKEPFRSEFEKLVREGAGTLDIHDAVEETSFTLTIPAYEALVEREVSRVDIHRKSLNAILEEYVGSAERILDVGCSTGGTTVAMALSPVLGAKEVIGLDPNELSLRAARVRAKGYDLDDVVSFRSIAPGERLPFDDEGFDLTICVSVIEYVYDLAERYALVRELLRVTKPNGYVLLVTPNPLRVIDYHTKRLLGDWRRSGGYPWSSPPWQLSTMLSGCDLIPLRAHQIRHGLAKRGMPGNWFPDGLGFIGYALPWQKVLAQKRLR